MLKQLTVKNFALIENVQIRLQNGFTVITGETGSGKSILLGALKLILGERADYSVIRDNQKKTVVEAYFYLQKSSFFNLFNDLDLDFEEECIIRREINANGKSRIFINDTPVQLSVLKEIAEKLIYIHSQHHTLELKSQHFQRSFLDIMANNQELLEQYKNAFNTVKKLSGEIQALEDMKKKSMLEYEFNLFQFNELESLQLKELDYKAIEKKVERGEHYEEIKNTFQLIEHTINSDEGVLILLNRIKSFIKINDVQINELLERIKSLTIELKDIGETAENNLANLTLEPEKPEKYIHKLDAFNTVLQKHRLQSQNELLLLQDKLYEELNNAEQADCRIEEKKKNLLESEKKLNQLAEQLSASRKSVAEKSALQIEEILHQLSLEGATVHFQISKKELSVFGFDEINLFFSPNKGMKQQLVEKSASGGELSRLMLAIQYLLSQKKQLPTVIFDEIDTGVSGKAAQKIGEHLKKMGERMQLLAITHLPQVAGKGAHHILVEKEQESETTKTTIRELNKTERINAIAKLLSGDSINEAAILNAKILINEH